MSFTSIPILDLAQSRDPATKPQFLAELRHALMEVGFLYLKNVGIPDTLWREVISEGRAFFDIPEEEKYVQCHFNLHYSRGRERERERERERFSNKTLY
jgi:isopenicillin N synthase-like dioxygenase